MLHHLWRVPFQTSLNTFDWLHAFALVAVFGFLDLEQSKATVFLEGHQPIRQLVAALKGLWLSSLSSSYQNRQLLQSPSSFSVHGASYTDSCVKQGF